MQVSVYTARNDEGVEAHVFEVSANRYALRLLDADAGQWLPACLYFTELDQARLYADRCV